MPDMAELRVPQKLTEMPVHLEVRTNVKRATERTWILNLHGYETGSFGVRQSPRLNWGRLIQLQLTPQLGTNHIKIGHHAQLGTRTSRALNQLGTPIAPL